MKKNSICSVLLAASLLPFALSSCKKDKEPSRNEMLTTGKWKVISSSISPATDWDGDGDPDSDLFGLMDSCEKDNYTIFRIEGTVEENQGPTKCDPLDPQIDILNWSLKNNETILVVDGEDYTIEQLDETTLRLRLSDLGLTFTSTLRKF
jgi:hypothetical protein